MDTTVAAREDSAKWVKPTCYAAVGVTVCVTAGYMAKRANGPELLRAFAPVVAALGAFMR